MGMGKRLARECLNFKKPKFILHWKNRVFAEFGTILVFLAITPRLKVCFFRFTGFFEENKGRNVKGDYLM